MTSDSPAMGLVYRAVWRWHFIAGLLVLPFLVMLALTGATYLFRAEIDHAVYGKWDHVPVQTRETLPVSALIQRVEAGTSGQVLQVAVPSSAGESIRLVVSAPSGDSQTVFADPYDGRVLGVTGYGGVMQVIRKVHSLQLFGFWASSLVEIAAGWTIGLVIMGLFLWWPRGAKGGVVSIRGRPASRLFWRDTHAVVGAFAAAVILFLAVTGMPWSMFWGDHVQTWATARGLSHPQAPADVIPDWQIGMKRSPSGSHHHDHGELPWALEKVAPPESQPGSETLGVDQALNEFRKAGLVAPFTITLPIGPTGAYLAAYRPPRVEDTRLVYLDQYNGNIIGDQGFAQYGPVAKAIEWGVAVHTGIEYGEANRYLMLAGCVAILLLAGSALTMWLKRKPAGSLGIPPLPQDIRALRGALTWLVVLGVVFPLVGLTLVLAVLVELSQKLMRRPA
jgi:uncharacterized iron-regulated membrane protein